MRLYLLRHGESVDDIEDCYGGIADFPLTDAGKEKAKTVAEQLQNANIEVIFSSPLARARETADIIAHVHGGTTVIEVEDLQERNSYGVLSGVNKDKAAQVFKRIFANLKEKPGYSNEYIPGAEDYSDFILRVSRAFDEVIEIALEKGYQSFAIVTHGKFTQTLFKHVLKINEGVDLKLSAINTVEYTPATATLVQQSSLKPE
jgi:broad specificity phosphatase PhoE